MPNNFGESAPLSSLRWHLSSDVPDFYKILCGASLKYISSVNYSKIKFYHHLIISKKLQAKGTYCI